MFALWVTIWGEKSPLFFFLRRRKVKGIYVLIHGVHNLPFSVYTNHLSTLMSANRQFKIGLATTHGVKVAQARNLLVKAVKESGEEPDYVFFLDTDHIIPENTLTLLAQNMDEYSMVSGLICRRRAEMTTIGFLHEGEQWKKCLLPHDGKVYKVDTCAFGCTLIRFKDLLSLDEPLFRDTNELNEKGIPVNRRSDVNLCKAFREKGMKIAIDTRVCVGHVSDPIIIFPQNAQELRELKMQGKLRRPSGYPTLPEEW